MIVRIAQSIYVEGSPVDLALFTATYMRTVVKLAEFDNQNQRQEETTMEWLKDALSGLTIHEEKEDGPDADEPDG